MKSCGGSGWVDATDVGAGVVAGVVAAIGAESWGTRDRCWTPQAIAMAAMAVAVKMSGVLRMSAAMRNGNDGTGEVRYGPAVTRKGASDYWSGSGFRADAGGVA